MIRRKNSRRRPLAGKDRIIRFITLLLVVFNIAALIFLIDLLKDKATREEYPVYYSEYVLMSSEEFGLDPDVVFAVIKTESDFRADAVSSAGAVGLMQITKVALSDVNKMLGEEYEFSDMSDPYINIRCGCRYLRYLYDVLKDDGLVFAAYNGGITNVLKWLENEEYSRNGKLIKIPFGETERYVEKVCAAIEKYDRLYGGNYV